MTQTYNIGGSGGPFRGILRMIIAVAAVIGGFVLMAASAAVAFFLILGVVILASLVIAFLWGKAKITGKPFGPKAYFKTQGFDLDVAMDQAHGKPNGKSDGMRQGASHQGTSHRQTSKHGPIIDAHETPDGWSVDD